MKKKVLLVALIIVLIGTIAALVYHASRPCNCSHIVSESVATSTPEVASTTVDTSQWQKYTDTKNGFQIKYPYDWFVRAEGSSVWSFQNMPFEDNINGVGLPGDSKSLWVELAKGTCNNPTSDFVGTTFGPTGTTIKPPVALEKTVCKDGFQITAGLWKSNSHLGTNEKLLNQIIGDFKPITASTASAFEDDTNNLFPFVSSVVDTTEWQTYANTQAGYEIKHPSTLHQVASSSSVGLMPLCFDNTITCLSYSSTKAQPGKQGFGGAAISIGTMSEATSSESCALAVGGFGPVQYYSVNGIPFYGAWSADGGSGFSVGRMVYDTYHEGTCYSVSLGSENYECALNQDNQDSCDQTQSIIDMVGSDLAKAFSTFQFISVH